jgi:hypothetical protein
LYCLYFFKKNFFLHILCITFWICADPVLGPDRNLHGRTNSEDRIERYSRSPACIWRPRVKLGSGLRSFSRDGRLRCHRLGSPTDLPPQNYGTWCPGGVRPTPPELRNIIPGISGITAGIRWNKEIHVKWPRAEGDMPLQNYGTWGRGGYRPTPRNRGTEAP